MNSQATQPRAPVIDTNAIMEITDGVWVIPDSDHTPLMPNIGIVVGARATLVIDTGFGPDNARAVLEQARSLSDGRPVFLTHTHCHPEHGFGANVVAGKVTIVYNDAQWSELQHKGPILLQMFRKNFAALAPMLDGVEFVAPHLRYTGWLNLDLGGGHIVELHEFGGAHSLGDQGILIRGPASCCSPATWLRRAPSGCSGTATPIPFRGSTGSAGSSSLIPTSWCPDTACRADQSGSPTTAPTSSWPRGVSTNSGPRMSYQRPR